ncbi:MAG: adenylate cyclase, partial [Acetobacteraceae bacterium]|nr:adenylate cyclase [Acetobacteraceae bacterium]
GKIVQTGGDSLLIVFDSIDRAVRCAVKVQKQVPVYDGDQPPDRRIRFRVGINTGDAIPHGTDLHGDGVNIAARLEAQCPVGGICISRAVRDQVHLDVPFEPIGPLTLKNIARPVEAFVLRLDPTAKTTRWARSSTALFASLAVALLVGAGGAGWWLYRGTAIVPLASQVSATSPATATQAYTPPDIGITKAPRLSIVVLPFQNLSGDPKENYLAEGITEDVTTDLSRIAEMFVIARETAFTYQGKAIDVRKVGEEVGVRYVLEGSARKLGDVLRVNAQLIATETGAHLWADRFDQRLIDLNAGQEDIVRRISQSLNVALTDIESARSKQERPTKPDAFDLILHARSIGLHPMGPREKAERLALFEQALQLDPTSIPALTGVASELHSNFAEYFGNPTADRLERAAKLIADAAAIRPNDPLVLNATASILNTRGRYTEAISAYHRLLDEYPNTYNAYDQIGMILTKTGRAEDAIPMIETAIRGDPRNPYIYARYDHLGFALLLIERDGDSIIWTQRALAANPNHAAGWRAQYNLRLAAAHARLGHLDEARRTVAEANRLWPYDTVRMHWPDDPSSRVYAAQIARFQAALRVAGHRDHAEEDADFGVAPDGNLHRELAGLTPTTAPGAATIRTADLERLLAERKPIVVDPLLYSWGRSIPGAVGLKNAGWGGETSDTMQDRLRKKMQALAKLDLGTPIVAVGWNSERFDGRNVALRLVALGYTNVYWYRGGREAWEVAGLPETEVDVQDW